MCIVIDSDTFSAISNEGHAQHSEFKPLLEWIQHGNGKVVYGGTEYSDKLKRHQKFMFWLGQMEKIHKTVVISRGLVDKTSEYLSETVHGSNYNDHYIVAILIVSGCRLVSSFDSRLSKLIKVCYSQPTVRSIRKYCPCSRKLYRPRIYRNKQSGSDLLSDRYVVKLEHTA